MTHLENLEKNLGSLKGKKILDLGSGGGDFLIECVKREYDAVGLEIAEHKIENAQQNARKAGVILNIKQGAAEHVPFKDGTFDFVNGSELIEHVNDPNQVLEEIYRILKPGGQAYMSVHNRFGFRDAHFKTYGLNWMPRWMGEKYLSMLKRHKEYHERSGLQSISQMHYYTFRAFKRIGLGHGLLVKDMRIGHFEKKYGSFFALVTKSVYNFLLRPFYVNTFHILLTKPAQLAEILKIGYLTYDTDPRGGWGRYAHDLISSIEKFGARTVVLKEHDDGLGGRVILHRGPDLFWSALNAVWRLRRCDVIHALDVYPYGVIAWIAAFFLSKPFVITAVGTYSIAPFYNPKTKWLVRQACRSAAHIAAISSFTAGKLQSVSGIKNIQVINPGIDSEKFLREHLLAEEIFILSVGALKRRKGYHISIPAFVAAKSQFPELRYIIVGSQRDKGYFAELRGLVQALDVRDSVRFFDDVSDKRLTELYQRAKIFVLTSLNEGNHFEGYGLVFLEAAAAGTPVIGTQGNGIEDAVKDGYNGLLVPQNDPEKTARAIVEILKDEKRWQVMSRAAHEWAKQQDVATAVSRYAGIYEELFHAEGNIHPSQQ